MCLHSEHMGGRNDVWQVQVSTEKQRRHNLVWVITEVWFEGDLCKLREHRVGWKDKQGSDGENLKRIYPKHI